VRRRGRDASPSRHHTHRLARLLAALLLLVLAVPPAVVSAHDPEPTYSLTLIPSATRLEVGQEVTLTATLKLGDEPIPKTSVSISGTFGVAGGAAGAIAPSPQDTDEQGQATFTYTSDEPGLLKVKASVTIDNTTISSDEVTVTWFRVSELTLTPAALFGIAGEEVTLTATVRANDGGSAEGAKLTFEVTNGPNKDTKGTATVDKDGIATITYEGTETWTGSTDTDTVKVTGAGTPVAEATATVRWLPSSTRISLSPSSATGTLGLPQTLTAKVTDAANRALQGVPVRFLVDNQSQATAPTTNSQGEATFTYTSNQTGHDTITAYIDLNVDGTRQADEPQATATVNWAGRGGLTLSPVANTLTIGLSQSLTATLTDAEGEPLAGIMVYFDITGANTVSRGSSTNASGVASISYTGRNFGRDTVSAYADLNGNNRRDTNEPTATASITWVRNATLSLAVSADAPDAGSAVEVTATLADPDGGISGVPIRFSVTGSNATSGVKMSDATGKAVFTYTGGNVGTDTVTAYADFNSNGVRDTGEPSASVTINWRRPFAPADPSPAKSGCVYFLATQHNLCAGFRSYWEQFGGLAVYGMPITEEFVENGVTVQYFERARFEWHPGVWPERYDVLLGLLGNEVTAGRRGEAPFQAVQANPACRYFPETGHNLCGGFRTYWETFGGLSIYGLPISEEFQEVNPDTGLVYTVQYFERQRFEWHPGEWPERYDVMLGRIGVQVLDARYPNR